MMHAASSVHERFDETESDFDSEDDDSIENVNDLSQIQMRVDHEQRPMWVCSDGAVFLETFSPNYKAASDFLIAVAEPVPESIPEYRITRNSLYAAASIGLQYEDILLGLDKLSKNEISPLLPVDEMIKDATLRCGKVRLVFLKQRFFVESQSAEVLQFLLRDADIFSARIDDPAHPPPIKQQQTVFQSSVDVVAQPEIPSELSQSFTGGTSVMDPFVYLLPEGMARDPVTSLLVGQNNSFGASGLDLTGTQAHTMSDQTARLQAMGFDENDSKHVDRQPQRYQASYSFELHPDPRRIELVRRRCHELQYPMLEEYEFREDANPALDLKIQLKASVSHRDYQVKALSKMFSNRRARSGIIVLPCGAGKTLTGISAAQSIKKNTLVLATTSMAANQWKSEFEKWAIIDPNDVVVFTSGKYPDITNRRPIVLISTYSMLAYHGHRAACTVEIIREIKTREWGLLLLDEVHVVPAKFSRECIGSTHSRCKLGLTATLVREDAMIDDLFFLIGPKLYEANWQDLSREGHLARVQCVQVDCAMTLGFCQQYLKESLLHQRVKLQSMNPNKFRACEYLMHHHEQRGDKVMIFFQDVFSLRQYAALLDRPFVFNETSARERERLMFKFKTDPDMKSLLISSVGDSSLDLPDVNVIIQISSHFASRRQETQRLGRILRPKPQMDDTFNAYFYSLISTDTRDVYFAPKRQRYLVDQGYSFAVLRDADLSAHYTVTDADATPEQRIKRREQFDRELLMSVTSSAGVVEVEKLDAEVLQYNKWQKQAASSRRKSSFIANRDAKHAAEQKENAKIMSLLKAAV